MNERCTKSCILAWLLVLLSSFAQSELKILTLATSEFPPFEYSAGNKVIGSDTELVLEVLQRLGYQSEVLSMPWKRVQSMALKGHFAAIYSLTYTPDREKIYFYSDPISTVRDVFFKRKDKSIKWEILSDLYPYGVGASEGYSYHHSFMQSLNQGLFSKSMLTSSDSPELQGLRLVLYNRVDLFICEVSVCQFLINRNQSEFKYLDYIDRTIGVERNFHIAFPKAWPGAEDLADNFNLKLKEVISDGTRKRIQKKYGISQE